MVAKNSIWALLVVVVFTVLYAHILGIQPGLYHYIFIPLFMAFVAKLPRFLAHGLFGLLVLVAVAYYPTLVNFGPASIGIVAAAANTNARESYEYLQRIKGIDYGLMALFLLFSVGFFKVVRAKLRPHQWMLALLVVVLLVPVLSRYDKDYNKMVFAYKNGYFALRTYIQEQKTLRAMAAIPSSWQVNARHNQYQNYVVIMGESTRKDHLSAYGFAIETTPFLDAQPGQFFTGMVAPAGNTYFSIPRMFSLLKDEQIQPNNNIVTLAKAAGFETYWFSNQGFVGAADTEISGYALHADEHYFTKKADWAFENFDDFDLLPKLEAALNKPSAKPKLIVLHLMGTHYQFCDRLFPKDERLVDVNEELSCYASAVLKTDVFIKRSHQLLVNSGQSFSLNFLADHGLAYVGNDIKTYGLVHGDRYKENYEVPFLYLSSDDVQRRVNHAQKSGVQYLKSFSEWLGIDVEELKHQPSFFNDENADVWLYTREGTLEFNELMNDIKPQR